MRLLVLVLTLLGGMVGCRSSSADRSTQDVSSGESNGVSVSVDEVSIAPAAKTILVGELIQFEAAGGTPPYRFELIDHLSGDLDPESGLFTGTQEEEQVIVRVSDSDGASSDAFVRVEQEEGEPSDLDEGVDDSLAEGEEVVDDEIGDDSQWFVGAAKLSFWINGKHIKNQEVMIGVYLNGVIVGHISLHHRRFKKYTLYFRLEEFSPSENDFDFVVLGEQDRHEGSFCIKKLKFKAWLNRSTSAGYEKVVYRYRSWRSQCSLI